MLIECDLLLELWMMVGGREEFDGRCYIVEVKPGSVFRCLMFHCRLTNIKLKPRLCVIRFKSLDDV